MGNGVKTARIRLRERDRIANCEGAEARKNSMRAEARICEWWTYNDSYTL